MNIAAPQNILVDLVDSFGTFVASLYIGMNITHEYTCTLKLDCMCSIMAKKLRQHLARVRSDGADAVYHAT